jgi:hypothetical protein
VLLDALLARKRATQPLRSATALRITGESGRLSSFGLWFKPNVRWFLTHGIPIPPGEYQLDLRPLWRKVDLSISNVKQSRSEESNDGAM